MSWLYSKSDISRTLMFLMGMELGEGMGGVDAKPKAPRHGIVSVSPSLNLPPSSLDRVVNERVKHFFLSKFNDNFIVSSNLLSNYMLFLASFSSIVSL